MKNLLMSILLISSLIRGAWAVEPNYAEAMKPIVQSLIKGEAVNFDYKGVVAQGEQVIAKTYAVDSVNVLETNRPQALKVAEANTVAVIPICGPIMKADYCGDAGTATLAQAVLQADSNPNITAIVLRVDSPGGQVSGTATLAQTIKDTKKPVIAFVDDGLMASAAYWIGSAADKIIASQNIDGIGSIGVFTQIADMSGKFEKEGIKLHTVYATDSTEKNLEYNELVNNDNPEPMRARLDIIAKEFHNTVKTNRPAIVISDEAHPFKGGLFSAVQAVEMGLIDSIDTFSNVLKEASNLANKNEFKVHI